MFLTVYKHLDKLFLDPKLYWSVFTKKIILESFLVKKVKNLDYLLSFKTYFNSLSHSDVFLSIFKMNFYHLIKTRTYTFHSYLNLIRFKVELVKCINENFKTLTMRKTISGKLSQLVMNVELEQNGSGCKEDKFYPDKNICNLYYSCKVIDVSRINSTQTKTSVIFTTPAR